MPAVCDGQMISPIRDREASVIEPVGADKPVMSCDLDVLVEEAAKPVSSKHVDGCFGGSRGVIYGRALMQRSVRAVGVVMLCVLAQYRGEVSGSGDEEVVEAFPAQGADEALRDRVRPRCPDRGANDADLGAGEHGVERGGEFAVPVADQEPERSARSPRSISRLRACWVTQAPVG